MVCRMKYIMVALLVAGSAIVLYSCKQKNNVEETTNEIIKTEESENLTVTVSENGRKSYRFSTPLLEGYTLNRDPYREFRKGIEIITYQDDSMTTVNATLKANYAIYYEKRKLWEAKGNVEIHKSDGTDVYSQQMFWNSATKRIYSNVDTKLVTETDTYFTEGFESDEELNEIRFRHWNGKMQFDDEMLSGSDSTSVDNPEKETAGPDRKKDKPDVIEVKEKRTLPSPSRLPSERRKQKGQKQVFRSAQPEKANVQAITAITVED